MSATLVASRAGLGRRVRRRAGRRSRARRLSIIDLDTGDQPIANEDGTVVVVQNGEIYNYAELRDELERAGHRFRTQRRHRGARPRSTRSGATAFAERLRGMFAIAIWDATRSGGSCSRATASGSSRSTTATTDDELAFASELRALPRGEIDLDALEAFLAFNSVPGAAHDLPRGRASSRRGTCSSGRTAESSSSASRGPRRFRRRGARRRRGRARRGAARAAARLRARAPRQRRAGRRAPLRRRRLVRARRARRRGERPSRCARSRSGSRSGRSTSSPTRGSSPSGTGPTTASSCCGPTRRCSCPRSPTRSTSRSPTRRRCRPTSSRSSRRDDVKVALSGEGGDELFGGYYTYAADLLARARRRARAGSLRPLVERLPTSTREGELRLPGEALRARGAPAAARTASRLEGDLLARTRARS